MSNTQRPDPAPAGPAPTGPRLTRGTILKLFITFAVSAYVLWYAGLGDALGTLITADWKFVGLAGISAVVAMVMNVYRWKLMLHGQEADFSLLSLIRLYLVGMFFNNVLPGRFGGDVVRAYAASLGATTRTRSAAAVLMDRLVGAISVLILGVMAVVLNPSVIPAELSRLVVLGCGAAVLVLGVLLARGSLMSRARHRLSAVVDTSAGRLSLGGRLEAAIQAVRSYSRQYGLVSRALAISMVANGLSIVNLQLYSVAVGADISLGQVAVVAPAILAVGLLPLSVNGLGTIEAAFVVLFGAMDVDAHVALAVAILRRFVLLVLSLAGGVLYATRRLA
ncbi:MAG: lysylphosphatidylglycerol synthase transmembrane domain-containing protein [Chloroflexota bacterium]